jgi:protein O-mannosyl-transferase
VEGTDIPPSQGSFPRSFQGLFRSSREQTLLLCLVLAIAVLGCYNPVVHNGFVNYDDPGYITGNLHVRAPLSWATVKWAFTTYDQANWHPLTWISHAVDFQLFRSNPLGYHYENVLLHAVNAVLLFLLLQSATGYRWRSWVVAALFALHPLNVESVAWAAERKNVLSMLFFLLALFAYDWYTQKPAFARYTIVALAYALGLLAKPQIITFPFLLCLWDYWPLHRIAFGKTSPPQDPDTRRPKVSAGLIVFEKLPLLALSAASAILTMKAQTYGGAVQTFSQAALPWRLENAVIAYAMYIKKALWPSELAILYAHAGMYPAWQVVAALLFLIAVTVCAIRASLLQVQSRRYLAVGWLWFLGSLVPMIGLVQVGSQSMADRYAYLSFIGLFLLGVWFVGDWANAHRFSGSWLAFPVFFVFVLLGALTYRQIGYWHDTESVWLHAFAKSPSYGGYIDYGDFLLAQGRIEEAGAQYRAALAILPDGPTATLGMGDYEDLRGNSAAAIDRYQAVASRAVDASTRATGYDSLGFEYRKIGNLVKAKECFAVTLKLAPTRARAMTGLGLIAQQQGDLSEAVHQYSRAISAQPTDVGYLLLAQALELSGQTGEAREIYATVERFSPDFARAKKSALELLSGR